MGDKDIISKQIIKHITYDLATYLLDLDIDADSIELIETEHQRIEDRRADLVARVCDSAGESFILHLEVQNNNQTIMQWRMLRYLTDIKLGHGTLAVRQYLIYIGREPLTMAKGIHEGQLNYTYNLLDMHHVDCETLISRDNPDALLLAILCDFKETDPQVIINRIVLRLHQLIGSDERQFREYISILEILSENRDLKQNLKEAENMLTQVKVENLPSYELGMEKGKAQGEKLGELRG